MRKLDGSAMMARPKTRRSRRSSIETRIRREQMRSSQDTLRIMSMKNIRLHLREEIRKAEAMVLQSADRSPA